MTKNSMAFRVFNEIGIINQLTSAAFASILPKGMTIAQFSVLNHFVRLKIEAKSPKDLASAFQLTRPTMTSTLKRMEKAGLVRISPDPDDGRGKLVSMTDVGRNMREKCLKRLDEPLVEARRVISEEAFQQLLPLLAEMREKLDNLRD